MCGIAGIINFEKHPVAENSIRKMMDAIKHRGPDDSGIFLDDNLGFGFVRLSILDLTSAGHQPMESSKGDSVIIYNGEVYNYLELKETLKKLGYQFTTNTDTEVILNAYLEWGEDCLNKFNGMWAFAIYNKKTKNVFISRDRYGIKPFYYTITNDSIVFASEIPAITKVLKSKPEANLDAVYDYLVYNRTDQNEKTFFKGIHKLQHGHKINVNLNSPQKIQKEKWYDLRKVKGNKMDTQAYRDLLDSSVTFQMRSDVPVGVCLSGGLDSSSIVTTLLKNSKTASVASFSAVYNKGQVGDESEFINEYKNILSNMHFSSPTADSLMEDLKQFVVAHAEPIPSTGAYAQFKVMELARKNVVVTLSGQGADEQLAGYHYLFGIYFKQLFLELKFLTLFSEIYHYVKKHRSVFGVKTFIFFMFPKKMRFKIRVNNKNYLDPDFARAHSTSNSIEDNLYSAKTLNDSLIDHFEYKLEHLLKWEDRNSMWFSVESRVPFLDHRLVEQTLSLPANQIINKGSTKFILREAMRGRVPSKIVDRQDKMGYGTPEAEWFRKEKWKSYINELLNSDSLRSRKIVDPVAAKKIFKQHIDMKNDHSKEIWKWIHLELWFREFID
jgi:asparagine synthase (glutamine-hydrolysing)